MFKVPKAYALRKALSIITLCWRSCLITWWSPNIARLVTVYVRSFIAFDTMIVIDCFTPAFKSVLIPRAPPTEVENYKYREERAFSEPWSNPPHLSDVTLLPGSQITSAS